MPLSHRCALCYLAAGLYSAFRVGQGITHNGISEGFREFGVKTCLLVERPVFGELASFDFRIAYHFYLHIQVGLVLDRVVHVKDKTCVCRFWESITVQGGTWGRGQFCFYSIAVEEDRIVSRFRRFVFVAER